MSYKRGDIVKLKSGGAKMTVRCKLGDNGYHMIQEPYLLAGYQKGDVLCEWHYRNNPKCQAYSPDQLEYAE